MWAIIAPFYSILSTFLQNVPTHMCHNAPNRSYNSMGREPVRSYRGSLSSSEHLDQLDPELPLKVLHPPMKEEPLSEMDIQWCCAKYRCVWTLFPPHPTTHL